MEGTVKFFNKLKGFGFIKGDDERDYFVHITAIEQGKYLQEGDRVSFDGQEDDKGLKAQNVKFLSKGAPLEESQPEEESQEESEQPAEESEETQEEPAEEEQPAESEEPAEEESQPEEKPAEEETPAEELGDEDSEEKKEE